MITINTLKKMKSNGEKITMLTCYDATFAKIMQNAKIDTILVGDSLGMVVKGEKSTLSVTLDQICYHTKAVSEGNHEALIIADLPFGYYQKNKEQAFSSSVKLMKAGAHMVKLEGGEFMAETTAFLQERGIPVCAHIGLTPQSVNAFGGYIVQGKTNDAAENLLNDAKAHENAAASIILMECVPADLAKKITESVNCPTIGIGAGVDCDGQVLVMHDMLGITSKVAKFVKNFMKGNDSIQSAFEDYAEAVKTKKFPTLEHSF